MLRLSPRFYRAHGLGNDYLVVEPAPERGAEGHAEAAAHDATDPSWPLTPEAVEAVCRRGFGAGSDGIVVLLNRTPGAGEPFPLRMFNPDGSEFERSGNGLRILGTYLRREGLVDASPFQVRSGGETMAMQVHGGDAEGIHDVSVQMGRARAGDDARSPVAWTGGAFEVPHPRAGEGPVTFVPVWVGNPHAVVFVDDPQVELDGPLLRELGPHLATHPGFGRGTNVQLARVASDGSVHLGIWERGVGRTPASGTSSCAAAVAAVSTGRSAPGELTLRMPGGTLAVSVSPELEVTLRGPVQEVGTGTLTPGFVRKLQGLAGLKGLAGRGGQAGRAGRALALAGAILAGALGGTAAAATTAAPLHAQSRVQEVGVFVGQGSSGLAELEALRGMGVSYRVGISPRTALRASLFSGEHEAVRTSRVCIQYEPAVGCSEERVDTVTGLRGALVSGHLVQPLGPGVAVEGGAGVSLNRLQASEQTVSGRRSNLFARNTAQVGAALLATLRVGPAPRIPLLLEVGVAQHLVRLDACAADDWAYDPYCRTLGNLELRLGGVVRFGP